MYKQTMHKEEQRQREGGRLCKLCGPSEEVTLSTTLERAGPAMRKWNLENANTGATREKGWSWLMILATSH